jgi:hypothetical protein
VRKDEQRRMARPAGCDRVHSALTLLVSTIVVKNDSVHRRFQRKTSGQLRFVGSVTMKRRYLAVAGAAAATATVPTIILRCTGRPAPVRIRHVVHGWLMPCPCRNAAPRGRDPTGSGFFRCEFFVLREEDRVAAALA